MLQRGDLLRGRYRILRIAGSGGTAVVWEALDLREKKHVVVKAVGDREAGLRERGIHSQLENSGIPILYESFEEGVEENRCIYLVMEYVEGATLESIVREDGPMSVDETIGVGRQLCGILRGLHGLEPPVFHRDLKPSNVIRRPDGKLVLLDFGSAAQQTWSLGSSQQAGTLGYAAPEQFEETGQVDARTDVYGVCAVLHFLLTGQSPLQTGLRAIGAFVPALKGTPLEKLLARCLSVSPSMRCRNARELDARLAMIERSGNRGLGGRQIWVAVMTALVSAAALWGFFLLLQLGGGAYAAHRYGNYLEMAGKAGTEEETLSILRQAIRADPGRAEAYGRFLDVIAADGVIESSEKKWIEDCLFAVAGDGRNTGTCRECFQEGDAASYDRFALRLGLYLYAGEWVQEADRLFAQAEESIYLTKAERTLAMDMRLLTGTGCLDRTEKWLELAGAAHKLSERDGMEAVVLAIFRGICTQILYEREVGEIRREQMPQTEEVIREAERYLEKVETMQNPIPGNISNLLEETRTAVAQARKALSGEAFWR